MKIISFTIFHCDGCGVEAKVNGSNVRPPETWGYVDWRVSGWSEAWPYVTSDTLRLVGAYDRPTLHLGSGGQHLLCDACAVRAGQALGAVIGDAKTSVERSSAFIERATRERDYYRALWEQVRQLVEAILKEVKPGYRQRDVETELARLAVLTRDLEPPAADAKGGR